MKHLAVIQIKMMNLLAFSYLAIIIQFAWNETFTFQQIIYFSTFLSYLA
jgi:hypothetical protein